MKAVKREKVMKYFERELKIINKNMKHIFQDDNIYKCFIKEKDVKLLDKKNSINSIICSNKNNHEDYIKIFNNSISVLPQYENCLENRARVDILFNIAQSLGYFPFVSEDCSLYISSIYKKDADICNDFEQLCNLFKKYFNVNLILSKIDSQEYSDVFTKREREAYEFYVINHGEWLENFINNLQDKISQNSFISFIIQRIRASLFANSPICYPVAPPRVTANWRMMREKMPYDFPPLKGVSNEILNRIFYKYIFVYEQYGIPGIVEACPGDTVIDVGAFIGDTAIYFSRKVGETGKVLSFEISSESLNFAKENMAINYCDNVRLIQYALTDRNGMMPVNFNDGDASSNSICSDGRLSQQAPQSVGCITLDDFCQQNNEKVNFIKADIEGSEMSMLRGAKRIISRDAPICAICLYHKQNDFWEIPEYLTELRPDYKFWFRSEAEPVLFAKRG